MSCVTEEIDALATMGVSRTLRLVLPKVAALAVAMPLLTVWCSAAGILGWPGFRNLQLDLSWGFFMEALPRSVPLPNLWIGLSKGFVFGLLIGLIACHFGLRVEKPNTEKPVDQDNSVGGDLDYRRDPGRCGIRNLYALRRIACGMSMLPVVDIQGVTTRFGDVVVHRDIDLVVHRGEMLGLVGGSGSGKTTLLREVVGLLRPTEGEVRLFGTPVLGGASPIVQRDLRRRFGMLFQQGALFSTLPVFDNIAFPLRELKRLDEEMIRELVWMKLAMVEARSVARPPDAGGTVGQAWSSALHWHGRWRWNELLVLMTRQRDSTLTAAKIS